MPLYIKLKITKPRQYFGTRSGFCQVRLSRFGIRIYIQEGKKHTKIYKTTGHFMVSSALFETHPVLLLTVF
jgi:hypothetical protein